MVTQSQSPRLILTRPRAQAERFARELALDLPIVIAPLMEIALRDPGSFDGIAGLVLTSENGALACAGQGLTGMPAYCVGPRTAQVAMAQGLAADALGGDADSLVAALIALKPPTPLLHLHGAHVRGDVAARLTAAGLPCAGRVAYDQQAVAWPDGLAVELAQGATDLVALFSPRTAQLFRDACPQAPGAVIVCLSAAVADALDPACYGGVEVAADPTGAAMGGALSRRAAAMRLEGPPTSS